MKPIINVTVTVEDTREEMNIYEELARLAERFERNRQMDQLMETQNKKIS